MSTLDELGILLADLPVYFANGLLVILYALAANFPALLSLACACGCYRWFDQSAHAKASFVPRRGPVDNSAVSLLLPVLPMSALLTALALGVWLVAQWLIREPVPWIGASMWLVGLAGVGLAPNHQRENTLWFVKTGLILYSLAVITSRIYLSYTAQLTPEQWAGLIGSTESAAAVIANTRSSVTTVVLWALWLVIPLGYGSLLVQQLLVNPRSSLSPGGDVRAFLRHTQSRR
jgi:hypothetical protein